MEGFRKLCKRNDIAGVIEYLKKNKIDVNERSDHIANRTVLGEVAKLGYFSVAKILISQGARFDLWDLAREVPLDECNHKDKPMARLFIANGARIKNMKWKEYGRKRFGAYERSVLQCRSRTVAFLRVKRAGNLWRWDKFLLREIALAVWLTRL